MKSVAKPVVRLAKLAKQDVSWVVKPVVSDVSDVKQVVK